MQTVVTIVYQYMQISALVMIRLYERQAKLKTLTNITAKLKVSDLVVHQ